MNRVQRRFGAGWKAGRGGCYRAGLLVVLLAVAGCSRAGTVPRITPVETGVELGKEVAWVRDAAEYEGLLRQAYRLASERLPELVGEREAGSWAVAMDADETLISNLDYSIGRAGKPWSAESWAAWVEAEQATALPGVREFIQTVRDLGGKVAVVTNRAEEHCAATRRNLGSVEISFDTILCKGEDSSKEQRWDTVRAGEAPGLGAVEIVMWVGDNIHDFPGLDQEARGGSAASFKEFGMRYFLLPNPLYGSWE